jgi:hypothetical protein
MNSIDISCGCRPWEVYIEAEKEMRLKAKDAKIGFGPPA